MMTQGFIALGSLAEEWLGLVGNVPNFHPGMERRLSLSDQVSIRKPRRCQVHSDEAMDQECEGHVSSSKAYTRRVAAAGQSFASCVSSGANRTASNSP